LPGASAQAGKKLKQEKSPDCPSAGKRTVRGRLPFSGEEKAQPRARCAFACREGGGSVETWGVRLERRFYVDNGAVGRKGRNVSSTNYGGVLKEGGKRTRLGGQVER